MSLARLVVALFLIANPVGNSPAILALIKDFDFARQKKIMLREALIAFMLAIAFQYGGEIFLSRLQISHSAVGLCGGILLLICALNMIFSPASLSGREQVAPLKEEPLLVPIATPLISGPGVLTMIMVFTKKEDNHLLITLALVLTWLLITAVMVSAPYLQSLLKPRGMGALEQLMGMLLTMMATQMIVNGVVIFAQHLQGF